MKPVRSKRPRWLQLLALGLAAHLLFCVQRIEIKALPGRLDEISRWRELGPVGYHLGRVPETTRAVQFLVDEVPEDAVILRKGEETRGLIEHAAALLAPRLLYEIQAVPPDATEVHSRRLARARHPELGEGTLVLVVVDKQHLRLELR